MNDNRPQESATPPSGFNDPNKQILEFCEDMDELKMLLQQSCEKFSWILEYSNSKNLKCYSQDQFAE